MATIRETQNALEKELVAFNRRIIEIAQQCDQPIAITNLDFKDIRQRGLAIRRLPVVFRAMQASYNSVAYDTEYGVIYGGDPDQSEYAYKDRWGGIYPYEEDTP